MKLSANQLLMLMIQFSTLICTYSKRRWKIYYYYNSELSLIMHSWLSLLKRLILVTMLLLVYVNIGSFFLTTTLVSSDGICSHYPKGYYFSIITTTCFVICFCENAIEDQIKSLNFYEYKRISSNKKHLSIIDSRFEIQIPRQRFTKQGIVIKILLASMQNKKQDIIIQLGSESIRVGLVGDKTPRKTISAYNLLTPNHTQTHDQYETKVQEALYTIFFSYVNCSCQSKTVIILENVFTDRRILEVMAKVMFKKLGVYKIQFALCCVTPLYLTSKYSGIVINCGANFTQIMPIFQSYPLIRSFKHISIGTHALNKRINDQLALRNNQIKTEVFQQMSEAYLTEIRNLYSVLPNNSEIVSITYKKTKLKFDPKALDYSQLFGDIQNEEFNMAHAFVTILKQVPINCLNQLCGNVVFAGGLWRVKGMQSHFKKQVLKILNEDAQFKKLQNLKVKQKLKFVSWSFNPSEIAWIGCSAAACVRNIQHMSLKRTEYNQTGFTEKVMESYFNSV